MGTAETKGSDLAKKLGCDWQSDDPLILPEVWDVASARLLVEAGFPVLTTSAAAYAWAQGYRPGERVGLEELLIVAGRIIRDCQIPGYPLLSHPPRQSQDWQQSPFRYWHLRTL